MLSLMLVLAGLFAPPSAPEASVLLWNNGAFHTGNGVSLVQDLSLGLTTVGFNHAVAANQRVADDFEARCKCGTRLLQAVFFAYQTGSTTTSTFNTVRVQVWSGRPGDPGSFVLGGDLSTNRLGGSAFVTTYRDTESSGGSTARPIMAVIATMTAAVVVPPGSAWIEWQTGGTLASGPWAVPVTVLGQAATGNGRHFNGSAWVDALDAGLQTPQGFAFELYGSCQPCQ
jgi:hypothetical protein